VDAITSALVAWSIYGSTDAVAIATLGGAAGADSWATAGVVDSIAPACIARAVLGATNTGARAACESIEAHAQPAIGVAHSIATILIAGPGVQPTALALEELRYYSSGKETAISGKIGRDQGRCRDRQNRERRERKKR
ncbi:hypothetical protein B7463_g8947, partial [Scytalidium lignicola]